MAHISDELLTDALSCLRIKNDSARYKAYKQGILKVIQIIGDAESKRQDQPSTKDLRADLESIEKHARGVRQILRSRDVVETLRQGLDSDLTNEINEMLVLLLHEKGGKEKLSSLMQSIEKASAAGIKRRGLVGRRGPVNVFDEEHTPKVRLAMLGMHLYEKGRRLKRRPNHNNEPFKRFLDILWLAATGGEEIEGWGRAIRSARLKIPHERYVADLSARLEVATLMQDIQDWEKGSQNEKKFTSTNPEKS